MKDTYIALERHGSQSHFAGVIDDLIESLIDSGADIGDFDFYLINSSTKLKLTLGE
jgi:hypothetical protein